MRSLPSRFLYRKLLRLYPHRFRRRFGQEMEQSFADLLVCQTRLRGWMGWCGVWLGGLVDLFTRAAFEHSRRPHRPLKPRSKDSMQSLFSDLRFAFRTLLRRPLFTATAVVTLALGIGANSVIFSIVNGLMLRPFPYSDTNRLVRVWSENPQRGWTRMDISMSDAWEWRRRTECFQDLAVYDRSSYNWTGGEHPERLEASQVSFNVFQVFGVQPALGRDFREADGQTGSERVVMLNDRLWQSRFGRRREILGSVLMLDGDSYTVVGVMPPGFDFPDSRPALWVPLRVDPLTLSHSNHGNLAVARLADGVSADRADAEVKAAAAQLAEEFPDTNKGFEARVIPLREDLVGPIAFQASAVLMGAVGFVLLIACANVANLLLSRSNSRRHEIAVRSALGAGRGRVVRQLLTESFVLAVLGGMMGVALAFAGLPAVVSSFPGNVPPVFSFALDYRVLLFTLAVALGTALVFGLLPALRVSRASAGGLQEGGRFRQSRGRLGGLLVSGEMALALVLMVGGTVLMRSVIFMYERDLGFEPDGILTMQVELPKGDYPEGTDILGFFDQVLERVRSLPGVESAGLTYNLPLSGSNWSSTIEIAGREEPADSSSQRGISVRRGPVTPGYLDTMRARLLRGRLIQESDRTDSAPVVVVNEAFVRRHLEDVDPLTQSLILEGNRQARIVGVIGDMFERNLNEPIRPAIYQPYSQLTTRRGSLAVRGSVAVSSLAPAIQRSIWEIDPNLPIDAVRTQREILKMRIQPFQLIGGLMGLMAAISLLLSAVGVYGVSAYNLGQRRAEMGVRMALGARRRDVLSLVLGEGLKRSLAGLVVGILLSFGLVQSVSGLLVGVSATDPLTFVLVPLILALAALLGCYLPASRASAIDPVQALRYE